MTDTRHFKRCIIIIIIIITNKENPLWSHSILIYHQNHEKKGVVFLHQLSDLKNIQLHESEDGYVKTEETFQKKTRTATC